MRPATLLLVLMMLQCGCGSEGGTGAAANPVATEGSSALGTSRGESSADAVPDEAAAIRIAEREWRKVYGDLIDNSRPFTARLEDGVWWVKGTLPEGTMGGVPWARIRKHDGKVLYITHTQ